MEVLINLFHYEEKECIPMNTWIAGKDLMKHYCLTKKIFIVVWTWNTLQTVIIAMQKTFKMNNLGDYLDLYVQSDTLLLEDLFKKFRNKFIEIYELDPAYFYLYLD